MDLNLLRTFRCPSIASGHPEHDAPPVLLRLRHERLRRQQAPRCAACVSISLSRSASSGRVHREMMPRQHAHRAAPAFLDSSRSASSLLRSWGPVRARTIDPPFHVGMSESARARAPARRFVPHSFARLLPLRWSASASTRADLSAPASLASADAAVAVARAPDAQVPCTSPLKNDLCVVVSPAHPDSSTRADASNSNGRALQRGRIPRASDGQRSSGSAFAQLGSSARSPCRCP